MWTRVPGAEAPPLRAARDGFAAAAAAAASAGGDALWATQLEAARRAVPLGGPHGVAWERKGPPGGGGERPMPQINL